MIGVMPVCLESALSLGLFYKRTKEVGGGGVNKVHVILMHEMFVCLSC